MMDSIRKASLLVAWMHKHQPSMATAAGTGNRERVKSLLEAIARRAHDYSESTDPVLSLTRDTVMDAFDSVFHEGHTEWASAARPAMQEQFHVLPRAQRESGLAHSSSSASSSSATSRSTAPRQKRAYSDSELLDPILLFYDEELRHARFAKLNFDDKNRRRGNTVTVTAATSMAAMGLSTGAQGMYAHRDQPCIFMLTP